METFALAPEQGSQIVQHLRELEGQLLECLEKWSKTRKKTDDRFIGPGRFMRAEPPEEIKFKMEIHKLAKLSDQVKEQAEQGHVEKQLLIELNEKLGVLQSKYGHILVFSATVAAIISGLKDLIEIFAGQ